MNNDNKQNDLKIVNILSHSRHDWMNKLQLIKGNLSLEKYDRIKDIIEEIVIEAQQESKLCNLKMPCFASFLLTYNWNNHPIYVEYEVLGDVTVLEHFDERVTQWCSGFLGILNQTVDSTYENHLCITIDTDTTGHETVKFKVDFEGKINHIHHVEEWLHSSEGTKLLPDDFHIDTFELNTTISL
ncbi:Spo0B C-terminal domain-containing protein [Bacillus weihaiensis]|uniref:Sporulation initiation phosphotransferase B C-terminal domain-containing protein n=1 Tax=Bacillus weihaiensis TaxID=1547283 RepID=A0A1L3MPH0_9BACI|nr:Spo0B C-terminal domain-containing protein [Bacillus weihaiensis]APH04240.1 hypothetical protein A9C19_05505 [Bacillus weihaiensis]